MISLRDYLLDTYGGFADRRFKDASLDHPIRVDDRSPRDVHPHFCSISVSVPDRAGEALILTLRHCPAGPQIVELVESLGGTARPTDSAQTIHLPLKSSQGPALRRLARAIRAIVGRGRHYDGPNLKWICQRTAASLERLAEHLELYPEARWPDPGRFPEPIVDRSHQALPTTP